MIKHNNILFICAIGLLAIILGYLVIESYDRSKENDYILVSSLQKTASQYIAKNISWGLNYYRISAKDHGTYEEDISSWDKNKYNGVYVNVHGCVEDCVNTARNSKHKKVIVHVRDPRQLVISWLHNVERSYRVNNGNEYIDGSNIDKDTFFNYSFKEQVDWVIENHMPFNISTINEWMEVYNLEKDKKDGIKIKFTTFEQLIENEDKFFDDILEFNNISTDRFARNQRAKEEEEHFRKGQIDEWRSVMTEEQKQKVNSYLDDSLIEFFGWTR